jgi:tetracycline 7-halogenase / FADH2 O2-dependent halogenase
VSQIRSYDIVIAGSGMASSILGMILARHGLSVALIERGQHPQFAIGESTIPQTSLLLKVLSLRHGIPELDRISSFDEINRSVTRTCGQKSNFGFIFQRAGQRSNAAECHQLGVARANFRESHLFRQDIDSFLLQTAIRYGCAVYQKTTINDVTFEPASVRIELDREFTLRARCFVDGSGYASLLARKLAVRDVVPKMQTTTRTLFTHMIDVKPFDDCVDPSGPRPPLAAWHQGTLHHIFRDGWMWVIPFNNHPDHTNQLVSVGLQLDPRRRPKPSGDPIDEFRALIADYPDVSRQFADAKPVREWISSGRLQYTSHQNVGDRWCLLSHSSGFVDPLFSRGLSNTMEVISQAAETLLSAAATDDFSSEHLRPIDTLQRATVQWNDRLVHGAYVSFRNFDLWNAWFRIWGLSQIFGVTRVARALLDFERSGQDPTAFRHLERPRIVGALTPDHPRIAALIEAAHDIMVRVEDGTLAEADAADRMFDLFRQSEGLPPNFEYSNPAQHFGRQGLSVQLETDHWLFEELQAAA